MTTKLHLPRSLQQEPLYHGARHKAGWLVLFRDSSSVGDFEAPPPIGNPNALALAVVTGDLLREHPTVPQTQITWHEGMERFLFIGMDSDDSIDARLYVCGVDPLQVRAVALYIHEVAMKNVRAAIDANDAPSPDGPAKSGLVLVQ